MNAVVVGTAGHIDHGKSALVRALTGIDPDRLKEEKIRGITIDLGFAHLTVGEAQLAFVDVPGHERFVRNMLAGAGGIDAVMLVVAATESVKPQTREHFEICRLLGIERGLIAVTKADLADGARLAQVDADCRDLVAGSFLDKSPVLHVSAVTGKGLDALRLALAALAGHPPRLHRPGVVRLPIDRVFTVRGFGAVVTGTLVSGAVATGDTLAAMPGGASVRVRGLQVHGRSIDAVEAPQRVAMNLTGVEAAQLGRGVTIATPRSFIATSRADVHVRLLGGARPLAHGARVRVHHGTMEAFARVSLAAIRPERAAPWEAARAGDARVEIPPGGEAFARLRFGAPVVLTRGDKLILRAASPAATIGGARVLDPSPAASGVRRESAMARFEQFDTDQPAGVVSALLAESAGRGLGAEVLVGRAGLDPGEARAELDRCIRAGDAIAAGERAFAEPVVSAMQSRVTAEIARFHQTHPADRGIPRETLRIQTAKHADEALFPAVLARLTESGLVRGTDRIALTSHQPAAGTDARARGPVEARFRQAGLGPPDPAAVPAELGLAEAEVQSAIRLLVQEGKLVRVGNLVFHREPLTALKAQVAGLRQGQPPGARVTLDVSAFKVRHGLSRKFAIPLLEWLDRERVTRRVGDLRLVL